MDRVKKLLQGKLVRFFIILYIILGAGAVVHSLWVHDIIDSAFESSLNGTPSVPFIDHERHDHEYYHKRADLIFWQYMFFGIPLTLLFWIGVFKLFRRVMSSIEVSTEVQLPQNRFRHDTVAALLIYCALTMVYFAPSLGVFGSHIIGPPEDNMGGYWNLWYSNEMVVRGEESLTHTNMLYFPEGTSMYYFAWSFYNFAISVLLWIVMSPAAVFNLIILHSYPLAGLGAFLLVRYITGNSLVAIVGGFIFAFSPYHFGKSLHHGNLNAIQFIPFFVLYFIRAIREGGAGNLALASLFFFLTSMCDWNYMVIAGYFVLFGYVYLAVSRRQWIVKDYIVKAAVVVGATHLVVSPWLIEMVKLGLKTSDVEGSGLNTFVADFAGLFIPGAFHWAGQLPLIKEANQSYTGNAWESASYLGIAAMVVVVAAFPTTRKLAAKWWLGFAAFVVMALGPQLHFLGKLLPVGLPYTVIAYLPFLSNVRATGRFMVFAYLFWAVIVSLSLLKLWERGLGGVKKTLITAMVVAVIFLDYFAINYEYTKIEIPSAMKGLAADGQEYGLLNIPRSYQSSMRYMMQQTFHRIPIVDGAATRKIGDSLEDRLSFSDLKLQQAQLTMAKVKYIVVHLKESAGSAVNVESYRGQYELVSEDQECVILKVY